MSPVGFETTVPASVWSQTHELRSAVIGMGGYIYSPNQINYTM